MTHLINVNLGDVEFMTGRGRVAFQSTTGATEHSGAAVQLQGRLSYSVELELLVYDAIAVLDKQGLACSAELTNSLKWYCSI